MFKFAETCPPNTLGRWVGKRCLEAVDKYEDIIARNVAENLYKRHISQVFLE